MKRLLVAKRNKIRELCKVQDTLEGDNYGKHSEQRWDHPKEPLLCKVNQLDMAVAGEVLSQTIGDDVAT